MTNSLISNEGVAKSRYDFQNFDLIMGIYSNRIIATESLNLFAPVLVRDKHIIVLTFTSTAIKS